MAATFKLLHARSAAVRRVFGPNRRTVPITSAAPNAAREAALWAVGRGMIPFTSRRARLQNFGMSV